MPMPYFWWSLALVQAEALDHLLGERAARALGEDRVLGAQLHAAGEVGLGLAVLGDAHVAGGDADHLAVLDQHFGGREARIDLDAERLGLAAEIAGDVAERADEIAVVVHELGHEQVGQPHAAGVSEKHELVVGDLGLERPVRVVAPFGQEPVEADGVDHRAGEDVGADLRAFLDHDHGDLRPASAARCLRRMAVARPAGPAPTITTSKSIDSRGADRTWLALLQS